MTTMTTVSPISITEKMAWLENRYWKFGTEEEFEDLLLDIFEVDDEGQRLAEPQFDPLNGETKGLMVLGHSGNGKTALLMRALRVDPVLKEFKVGQGGNTLYITVPPEATIKKLAEIILSATGYTKVDQRLRAADTWEIACHRFSVVGIKAVIIDECHHILRSGPGRDVPGAIQSLKHIMQTKHRVALIIAGVPSLKTAIMSEPTGETLRRFSEFSLARIRPGSKGTTTFGKNFMKSAKILGLQVAEEDALPDRILFAENGQVGKSVALGKSMMLAAIKRGWHEINLKDAERIYRKSNSGLGLTPFDSGAWDVVKAELLAVGWGQ